MKMKVSGTFASEQGEQKFSFVLSGRDMGEVSAAAHERLFAEFGVETWHSGNRLEARDSSRRYGKIYFRTLNTKTGDAA